MDPHQRIALEAVRVNPEDGRLHYLLGTVQAMLGKMAAAADTLTTAVLLLPNDIEVRAAQGGLLARLGRHDEAVAVFDKFGPDDFRTPELLSLAAQSYDAVGRPTKARRLREIRQERFPDRPVDTRKGAN